MSKVTTDTATRYWVFEVRDSDGNDCTVYDVVVGAATQEAASDALWKHLEAAYPDDESDGGFGTYHACDCPQNDEGDTEWECQGHGGIVTNEDAVGEYGPQAYATRDEALATCAVYHTLMDLTARR